METAPGKEQVILVGVVGPGNDKTEVEETLDELANLAESAGAEVSEIIFQNVKQYDPASHIGKGKAEEIARYIRENGADAVIFDNDLTPAQVKNLSGIFKRKVIDRTGLILEIFAQNAKTRESKTQVEMALLEYQLPRLTGQWTHLERQVGGIGVRGPGETQLETDRRIVRRRMKKLAVDLDSIEKQRSIRRVRRRNIYKATIVGYTNAGKSTLFNTLTQAGARVEDSLFATLDSTVRRLELANGKILLLGDTVGFIRKLPHSLIASFRSTFGVVRDADLLLHLVDLSHEHYDHHIESVNAVLKEMGLERIPVILLFNKIDLVKDDNVMMQAKINYPYAVFISASRGVGIAKLIETISKRAAEGFTIREFKIPVNDTRSISRLYEMGQVLDQTYNDSFTIINVRLSARNAAKFDSLANQSAGEP
ncbi:GTPase HflX [candidate division KSB1 bacterium]